MADDSGGSPLTPPGMIEIPPGEYGDYYFQRNGRLFPRHRLPSDRRDHADVELPSILPVDDREMERRTVQHNMLGLARRSHTFGPFDACLIPGYGKVVLDIGSASGKWIEDVSENKLETRFIGVEIVPQPPTDYANAHFEVYDFQKEGIRRPNSSVDIVHARFQSWHIQDWPAFLMEVARVLKPGGYFLSGEFDIPLQYADASKFTATTVLYNQVQRVMHERGYRPDIGAILPQQLQALALFTDVGSEMITIPVGRRTPSPHREMSVLAMNSLQRLAHSLKPFLLSLGSSIAEVDGYIVPNIRELHEGSAGLVYRMAWAQRAEPVQQA